MALDPEKRTNSIPILLDMLEKTAPYLPPQGYGPAGAYPGAPAQKLSPIKKVVLVVAAAVVVVAGLGVYTGIQSSAVHAATDDDFSRAYELLDDFKTEAQVK